MDTIPAIATERRKFVTDTLAYSVSQVLLRLRGLITLPFFARIVGAEGYGVFVQTTATMALLVPLLSFRLDAAMVRFLSGEQEPARFRIQFFSALAFAALLAVVSGGLLIGYASTAARVILGDAVYADHMLPAAFLLASSILSTNALIFFRVSGRIGIMSAIILAQAALETILILMAVQLGHGVPGAFWALSCINALGGLGILMYVGQQLGRGGLEWQGLRRMLAYGIPLMPNSVTNWVVNYSDRLVITQLLGVAAVGAYSASYSLAQTLRLLVMPLGFVLFPLVSRLWDAGEAGEVRRYFSYVTRYYLLLALPAAIGLALVSQRVLGILATGEFITSTTLVFLVAIGIALQGLFQINVYAFHLTLKTKYVSIILLVSSLVNIGLNLVLVPVIGLEGSALATAITFLPMAAAAIIYGERLIGYRLKWLDIGKIVFATLVMGVGVLLVPTDNLAGLASVILVGALVYGGVLVALGTFSRAELLQLRNLIRSVLPSPASH